MKEDRLERSKRRAEEYQRRRSTQKALFIAALCLYVVVPVLWYGAIEIGLVHPIRTPELRNALHMASLTTLLCILYLYLELRKPEAQKEEKEPKVAESNQNSA